MRKNLGRRKTLVYGVSNFFFGTMQTVSYMAERVVGTGSFGIVFQVFTSIGH